MTLQPLVLAALIPLGLALLWSIQIVYAAGGRDDALRRAMQAAAWILILVGVAGTTLLLLFVLSIPLWLFIGIVALMAVAKLRQSERQALLWTLTLATEKGLPLSLAARSFYRDRPHEIGRRASLMADALDQGVPLEKALSMASLSMPVDALVGIRTGVLIQDVPTALRLMTRRTEEFDSVLQRVTERLIYLWVIIAVAVTIITFQMLKIVPVYDAMFDEFALDLPRSTMILIQVSQVVVEYYYLLLLPLSLAVNLLVLVTLLSYVGWMPQDLGPLARWTLRLDRSRVLRALSISVEHRQTIQGTIQHLAASYPKYYIRARLERAGRLIDQGQAWYDGLASEGIIRRGEAALLQSAQRAGNLPWALNELADGAVRRLALRLRVWLDAIMPLIVLVLGAMVLFIWVALFSPLVNMISDLSRINY